MKYLIITLCFIGVISGASTRWRTGNAGDDNENPWRNEAKGWKRSPDNDPSSWRNQKRALTFGKVDSDVISPPFYSYYEKNKKDKKGKDDQGGKGPRIAGIDEDYGVITCPPEIPKCIPRLGR